MSAKTARVRFRIIVLSILWLTAHCAMAQVSFDWVTVGDAGNAPDTLVMTKGPSADMTTGYGSVDYDYRIASTHVTNTQWVEFLNAVDPDATDETGIWNPNMTNSTIGGAGLAYTGGVGFDFFRPSGEKYWVKSGQENYPATWINWNSSARFVNWLHNGQGDADTENGVYDMSISTVEPPPRQDGATYFIPSEDEFYKAAYYDPTKDGVGGYWQYGAQSDTAPSSVAPPGDANSANVRGEDDTYWQYGTVLNDGMDHLTDVGAYTSSTSHYGLYDVDGLLYQWTEGTKPSFLGDELPAYRGGSWYYKSDLIGAAYRNLYSFRNASSYAWFGLRIASPDVPGVSGDFNDDGAYNCEDIDALVAEIASGEDTAAFDLTGDGIVNEDDLGAWLVEGGANNPDQTGGNPFLTGDANLDGVVDVSDFNAWNGSKLTATPAWCSGDFNADGVVDVSDFNLWNSNKFTGSMDAAAVPEPTQGIFVIVATIACLFRRRRRKE